MRNGTSKSRMGRVVATAAAAVAMAACAAGGAMATDASTDVAMGTNAFATLHAGFVGDDGALPDCTACHDVEAVAETTADWNGNTAMNPHSAHVPLDCGYCHTVEGDDQTMFCATCHAMAMPDGWVARDRVGGSEQE